MKETIILSVGGSLIVPKGGVNIDFLKKLNAFVRANLSNNRRFFLVAGGGQIARDYIDAGKDVIKKLTNDDLDWLGIHSTRLNAHLLRTIFRDIAHPRIVENYDKRIENLQEAVVIGGGWKPGWSTDYDAVVFARDYGANLILNMSNIYYVYDKDPNKYADAIRIEKTTWDFYESLVGTKWTPGLNTPFDPVAAQLAKKLGVTVIITRGDDFRNLQKILDGEGFKGTVIRPYDVSHAYYDRQYYLGGKAEYRHRYIKRAFNVYSKFSKQVINWYRALYIKYCFNPKTLLDVGCGTGDVVDKLRKLGVDAKGLEISHDALELASHHVRPFLAIGDITAIPFKDDSFDMVTTFGVMEHIERSKIKKAALETVRIAKKQVVHIIHTRENVLIDIFFPRDHSHVSIFSRGFWERLFNSFPGTTVARKFFRLPSFVETVYLLKKT